MLPSPACLALIKEFEGCRLTAYPDVCGKPTVGYGHTASSLQIGDQITQAQAEALLYEDVAFIGKCVFALTGEIPQCQFDACVSFAFNLGPERLRDSTLLYKLKMGRIEAAADEFPRWNKAGGKCVAGLTLRRMAERDLFLGSQTQQPEAA